MGFSPSMSVDPLGGIAWSLQRNQGTPCPQGTWSERGGLSSVLDCKNCDERRRWFSRKYSENWWKYENYGVRRHFLLGWNTIFKGSNTIIFVGKHNFIGSNTIFIGMKHHFYRVKHHFYKVHGAPLRYIHVPSIPWGTCVPWRVPFVSPPSSNPAQPEPRPRTFAAQRSRELRRILLGNKKSLASIING